jgi:hypothetical protein
MTDDESIIIYGVERYSDFDGYADTFKWTKAHHDVTARLGGINHL